MNAFDHPARRHDDLRWYWRAGMWTLAPFVEGWHGLSLVRFMAVAFTVTAVHGRLVDDQDITTGDCYMATLAVCAALGGKYVIAFLQRGQAKEAREERRSREVQQVRDADVQVPQGD